MKRQEGQPRKKRPPKRQAASKKLILTGLAILSVVMIGLLSIMQTYEPQGRTVEAPQSGATDKDSGQVYEASDEAETSNTSDNAASDVKSEKTVTKTSISTKTKSIKPAQGRLFVIIDDVGNSLDELDGFLKLPFPVTLAVMPGRPYTDAAIGRIKASGKPFIIHQPMEPMGDADPGECAVMSSMTNEEIKVLIRDNIETMPGALGMNNHMGSKITADAGKLLPVLEVLKEKNLVFVDSVTTGQTKGKELADALGIVFTKRNTMFLDNDKDRESIEEMVVAAKGVAAREGHAVMIGHVWSSELADLLLDLYPSLLEDGYELKDVRDLLIKGSEQ